MAADGSVDRIIDALRDLAARERLPLPHGATAQWRVILEFLRKTDHPLVARIARRMVNYMCWHGVPEAQSLLQRLTNPFATNDEPDDNSPMDRHAVTVVEPPAEEAFEIAAANLSADEILSCIETWIKDDKSAFLIEAVEHQHTSLADIALALERYEQFTDADRQLSRAVQTGLRVSLARRLLTDDLEFIDKAKTYIEVEDYHDVLRHTIATTASHGKLGGKSSGVLLASAVIRRAPEYAGTLGQIKVPRTWYMTSDGLLNFVEHNQLDDVHNHKYLDVEQIRREYPHIVQVFKHSQFPPELAHGLALALDDFGDVPLIVRSSSLLEDRTGAAFSGKYKSLFLANQGNKRERLTALLDAVAEVYASVFGPDPIEYRVNRGLLDLHEEMGIMIQEVVGCRVGPYYFPAYAGVAFSHNEFRWSPRIAREDGLLRIVPGLGTRAVDRVGDDYPVLAAPGKPGLRANVTPEEIDKYSPKRMDVLNLDTRRFETVNAADIIRQYGDQFPAVRQVVSIMDDSGVHRSPSFGWDPKAGRPIVTFEGLLQNSQFMTQVRDLLQLLRERLETPIDVEFASDGKDLYLLQCRPQSFVDEDAPASIPHNVPPERVLFSAARYVSNGGVPDLTHVVYVDAEAYGGLKRLSELQDVGRAVGRLNKMLPRHRFILIGPGRWGSRGDLKLGVKVTYSDINNTAMLVEVATRRGSYVPELSFGTHFFQDLVESCIRYLPVFPGDAGITFNDGFLKHAPNMLSELLPEYAHLARTLRVIDLPRATDGLVLRVLMNADSEQAVGFLTEPATAAPGRFAALPETAGRGPRTSDDHWRWRLSMAERIAAEADPQRFGIKAMYIAGSTKNATAGAASDIDLLVHVDGSDKQQHALELWLEGWSLCLSELNYLRTGQRTSGLLNVHVVTDEHVQQRTGYAAKIGSETDPARPLKVGTAVRS